MASARPTTLSTPTWQQSLPPPPPSPSASASASASADYPYRLRRESTASSASSSYSVSHATPLAEGGPNAISTLLQHPIVRTGLQAHQPVITSGYKAPTSRDIPPVALTNIPHVDAKAFHPYLAQVGSLYEAFQRAKSETEGEGALFRRDRDGKHHPEQQQQQQPNQQRQSRSRGSRSGSSASASSSVSGPVSISVSAPVPSSASKRRPSGQHHRRQAPTPLSTIPAVYSEPDFHLENPRTFDIVSEQAELVRETKPTSIDGKAGAGAGASACASNNVATAATRKSLATNAILQEKLSWYMDTVEVHLIASISTASKSFFSALGSLRQLHSEAADAITRIQRLRANLAKLDKDMAIDGLKVVNLKRRRQNVRKLAQAIMQLDDLVGLVRQCDDMVANNQIDTALDHLDRAERLMAGSLEPAEQAPPPYIPRDLRNLHALQDAQADLDTLRHRIGRGFEARFHRLLLDDIRNHVSRTETGVTLQRWGDAFNRAKPGHRRGPSVFPTYVDIGHVLRSKLEAELRGLTRARYSTPAATAFRTVVLREMKSLIRKRLPSSTDDDNVSTVSASTAGAGSAAGRLGQEKSSILARNLRALDADDWFQMLSDIYANTSEALRRLSAQVKILLDITSSLPDPSSSSSSAEPAADIDNPPAQSQRQSRPRAASSVQAEMQQALDLSSLLGEGVDLVQNQLTKVVRVRAQQNAELGLTDFLRYFTLNCLFIDECEAISGRSGLGLKTALDGQIKDFVAKYADLVRQRLITRLDADRWDAKDFGPAENALLERVKEGSVADSPYWTASNTSVWQSGGSLTGQQQQQQQQQQQDLEGSNGTVAAGAGAGAGATTRVRAAVIDDNKFILPDSGAALLCAVECLQHLTAGIPSMSSEVCLILIDTIKLFNSRSSQLVLGAGALRSAGLRNITTKHLALSSQALAFTLALIPYVREFYRRHLPASSSTAASTLAEFDNLRRRLTEHQAALYEKLIDIMSGRASLHVRSMKAMDWDGDGDAAAPPPVASPYMETLVKETTTLQKVLAKHLPENVVIAVMGPVFNSYRELWERAFGDVELHSEQAKERMLNDVRFLRDRLSKLDGAGDLGQHLVNVVSEKTVVSAPASASASVSASASASAASAPVNGSAGAGNGDTDKDNGKDKDEDEGNDDQKGKDGEGGQGS